MVKQDNEWGSRQRERQGHGASLGDILINIDLWSAESQIYAVRAVWGHLVLMGYTLAKGSSSSCRLDWENSTSADRACCSPLGKKKKNKRHPVKEHYCWYALSHSKGFCWHSYAGCRLHFITPLIDAQQFVMLIRPRSVVGNRESEDQARRVREQKSRRVFMLQPSREWVIAERKSTY